PRAPPLPYPTLFRSAAEEVHGARPHRSRADRPRRGGAARPRGDLGNRPARAPRAAARRLRRAARPLGPRRPRHEACCGRGNRPADDADRGAARRVLRPLLVIDGDSLAHRAYHAMPKSVRLGGVLGFTNMLLRLWQAEEPRAVLVGWDSIGEPTYRNEAFEAYQSGRVFDPELLEQLDQLPELVTTIGFAAAKGAGYEA